MDVTARLNPVLLLILCLGASAAQASQTVTFIHLNDLHANLNPHAQRISNAAPGETSTSTHIESRGGLARIATLVKDIRSDNPDAILMNIGDTYHGGVEASYTLGDAIVEPVNALNIDVGVPGNWDFGYGPTTFVSRYVPQGDPPQSGNSRKDSNNNSSTRPNFSNIAANVTWDENAPNPGELVLPPTWTKDINGIEVAFIGLSSDIVDTMHGILALGMEFLKGEDNYRLLINDYATELRLQGADIVVVMSELGIHKDYRLAQVIEPGLVDVIFSAHTHELTYTPLESASGALVVEAGNDGYLGRMDLTVDNGQVIDTQWQILDVDGSVSEDREVALLVDKARAPFLKDRINMQDPMPGSTQRLTKPIDTVIGYSAGSLDRLHVLENPFNKTFNETLRAYAGADASIINGFRFTATITGPGDELKDITVAPGEIRLEDLYRFFPVSYPLATADIEVGVFTGLIEANLTKVLSSDPFLHEGGWVEGLSGIDVDMDIARPDGQRILEMRSADSGQVLAASDWITVAGCSSPNATDTLCSQTGFTNVNPLINPRTGEAWTPVDFLEDVLSNSTPTPPARDFMHAINMPPLWPEAAYVQPLNTQ